MTIRQGGAEAVYIYWTDWGFHYKVHRYRLCEKTFEHRELVIGPFWFERAGWV